MELKTPTPLQSEHQALNAEINQAVKLEGRTGKATRLVARLMERHFAKEEEFALPPLGLLPALAEGTVEQEMAAAVTMAARLHERIAQPARGAARHRRRAGGTDGRRRKSKAMRNWSVSPRSCCCTKKSNGSCPTPRRF